MRRQNALDAARDSRRAAHAAQQRLILAIADNVHRELMQDSQ